MGASARVRGAKKKWLFRNLTATRECFPATSSPDVKLGASIPSHHPHPTLLSSPLTLQRAVRDCAMETGNYSSSSHVHFDANY
ncbi:hypothetical protein CDAR_18241 [Caerostris darwini]|uniref:Uncharacterized protein n=1 Tax=Caerostris darwini TaxID=1538125 RepID=A0AAV4VA48_9ARAC|nr:hypothetical protein CDAR_18241 [Caerostris darwini]